MRAAFVRELLSLSDLDGLPRGRIDDGGALVQDLVQALPVEKEEQDVLPALDDLLVGVDGFEVAGAKAQERLEQVAVAAAEFEAAAVDHLAPFAQEPFLDAVGGEGFSPAAEAGEEAADPRE